MNTIGDADRHHTALAVFLPAILDFERETPTIAGDDVAKLVMTIASARTSRANLSGESKLQERVATERRRVVRRLGAGAGMRLG
jgi:hypothetical protein